MDQGKRASCPRSLSTNPCLVLKHGELRHRLSRRIAKPKCSKLSRSRPRMWLHARKKCHLHLHNKIFCPNDFIHMVHLQYIIWCNLFTCIYSLNLLMFIQLFIIIQLFIEWFIFIYLIFLIDSLTVHLLIYVINYMYLLNGYGSRTYVIPTSNRRTN